MKSIQVKMKREKSGDDVVHVFFVATTKVEKINQMNALARIKRNKCIFLPITALGKPAHSPDEEQKTFSGNLGEKIYAAAHQLNGYSLEQAIESLKHIGFNESDLKSGQTKLYGMAEDSGYSFESNEIAQEFFSYFLNPKNADVSAKDREMIQGVMKYNYLPEKPFPGAETVDVVAACGGSMQFMRLVEQFGKARGYNVDPQHQKSGNWITFVNSSTLGAFEWEPGKKLNASTLGSKVTQEYGEHIQVFTGANLSGEEERLTYDYMATASLAKANGDFTSDTARGITFEPASRFDAYKNLVRKLKIKNLTAKEYSTYERTLAADRGCEVAEQFQVGVLSPATGFKEVSHKQHFIKQLIDNKMQASVPGTDSSSYTLHEDVLDSDAFYVIAPKNTMNSEAMLDHQALLSTLLVHKQLDPDGKNKAIIIQYDRNDASVETADKQLFTGYFNQGVYGDRPSQSITRVHSDQEALQKLKEARSEYRKVHKVAKDVPRAPSISSDLFHVAVFCSASLDGVFYEKGFALGKALAEENFGLAWGAGDRHMMGSLYEGYNTVEVKRGVKGSMIGSTTEVIGKTETKKGLAPEGLSHYYAAETITDRMDFLFENSQAYVFLEGGIGTLQEFYRYTWYAKNQPEVVKDKPVIIAQSAYMKDPLLHHAVDQFLGKPYKDLTENEKHTCGVTILAPNQNAQQGKKLFEAEVQQIIDKLKPHRDAYYEKMGITPDSLPKKPPEADRGYSRH